MTAKASSINWTYPHPTVTLPRVEYYALFVFSILIFLLTYFSMKNILYSICYTLLYIGLYLVSSYCIKHIREASFTYRFTPKHVEIKSKTRFQKKFIKFNLKDIINNRIDRIFLGGYLLTDTNKHPLFFSSKSELDKYEKFLKKHLPKLHKKK